ncbi:MAG: ATP-binding protein [Clostridia bacterium]
MNHELTYAKPNVLKKDISEVIEDFCLLAVPSGFSIAKLHPKFQVMFVNDVYVHLIGFDSMEEMLHTIASDIMSFIHPDDEQMLRNALIERKGCYEPYELTFRAITKSGNEIWLSQKSRHMMDAKGDEYVFTYYTDITEKKQAEQLIDAGIRGYDISLWEWDILKSTCHQAIHSSRCNPSNISDFDDFPNCLFSSKHYHPDSVKTARSVFKRVLNGEKKVEAVLQTFDPITKEYWCESVCYTTLFDKAGKPVKAVAIGKDITKQIAMQHEIVLGTKKYETLVNSIPGGVGLYKGNEELTPIYMSENTFALCGMTKAEYMAIAKDNTFLIFHPDDVAGMRAEIKASLAQNRRLNYAHRVLQKDGGYRWIQVSGAWLDEEQDGYPVLCTVFTDIHEQYKTQQALRESEMRYHIAVRSSNINIWEYHYDSDSMVIFSKSPKVEGERLVIPHYMESVFNEGHVRSDCVAAYQDMFEKMKNGAEEATSDIWIRQKPEDKFWCERLTYTNLFDESGKPIKMFCVGSDVTHEKEAEKRYHDEVSCRMAMQSVTLASLNGNLTQNSIVDHKSRFEEITKKMQNAKTLQDYFDDVANNLMTEATREMYAATFNREEMLRRFASGETTLSLETTRTIENHIYWTAIFAHMMKQIDTGDVMVFIYATDITNEKVMHNIMNAIVKTDYEFLVVVDGLHNTAVRYSENHYGNYYALESDHFEEETQAYFQEYICQEDSERLCNEVTIKNILAKLDDHSSYSVFYSVPNPSGGILKKQLKFSYIDSDLKSFLMARSDMTDAFAEEERKQKELVTALQMAEQANEAKSDFLSQVSHEIRTPINAIIGLAQVAEYNLHDPVLIKDCIDKAKLSSQYLLSLINDILDMSKIESGRVVLKNEVIDCSRFLERIKTIIMAQSSLKDIEFSVTGGEHCDSYYRGDALRLQQVIINILSNAVKFTPNRGKVGLEISYSQQDDETGLICFQMKDTGIGISPDFLPKLFDPFAQEHHGEAFQYGGNGLGLAISHNLVKLMGGSIEVQSTLGIGTTFTVRVPLTVEKNAPKIESIAKADSQIREYDFTGKRIMLVEDHPMNIMVARKLLEHVHAEVDVAENGKLAIELFRSMPEHSFDAILMDIRMPVMDGLQAAKAIRGLNDGWAKAVPIIAMSANAFDEDAEKSKEAGMNIHLSKPIDAQQLYCTLYSFLDKN